MFGLIKRYKKLLYVVLALALLSALGVSYKFVYEAGMDRVRSERADKLEAQQKAIARYQKQQAKIQKELAKVRQERAERTEERISEIRKSDDDCAGQRIPDDILRQLD